MTRSNPLRDPVPPDVPLKNAPLAKVLCVINFPVILKIVEPSGVGVADFQERIRSHYPILSQEQEIGLRIQIDEKGGISPQPVATPVWRFFDKEKNWRVTLGREAIGLETQTSYTTRGAFITRLKQVVKAFEDVYKPAQTTRVGTRYVNVFGEDRLSNLASYVEPEYRAFGHHPYVDELARSDQTAEFNIPEGSLIVRAGIQMAGQTHDPLILPPATKMRYVLDIDAITVDATDFAVTKITSRVEQLAGRAYAVFRGAVSDKFLEVCNG